MEGKYVELLRGPLFQPPPLPHPLPGLPALTAATEHNLQPLCQTISSSGDGFCSIIVHYCKRWLRFRDRSYWTFTLSYIFHTFPQKKAAIHFWVMFLISQSTWAACETTCIFVWNIQLKKCIRLCVDWSDGMLLIWKPDYRISISETILPFFFFVKDQNIRDR